MVRTAFNQYIIDIHCNLDLHRGDWAPYRENGKVWREVSREVKTTKGGSVYTLIRPALSVSWQARKSGFYPPTETLFCPVMILQRHAFRSLRKTGDTYTFDAHLKGKGRSHNCKPF